MILAWVISLLLVCSSLIAYLERLTALRIIEMQTMQLAHSNFMAAEKAVFDCEKNITTLMSLEENLCFIQPAGKNHWTITSKIKPAIQITVAINEKTGTVTRVNWRQIFE